MEQPVNIDVEYIKSIWPDFIQHVKKEKMVLANTLSKASINDYINGMLYIDVESQLQYNSITENQAYINETISSFLKQNARVLSKVSLQQPTLVKLSEAEIVLQILVKRAEHESYLKGLAESLSKSTILYDNYGILGLDNWNDDDRTIIIKNYSYLVDMLKYINPNYTCIYVSDEVPF